MSEDNPFTQEEINNLVQKGLLFEQLLRSDKFKPFFAINYDLIQDDEKKEIFLVEVPDEVAAKRVQETMKAQAKQAPSVTLASTAEMDALTKKK